MKKLLGLSILFTTTILLSGCANHTVLGSENTTNISNGAVAKADKTLQQGICEIKGGEIEVRVEGEKKSNVCIFNDESYCYLNELFHNKCSKGTVYYYNENADTNISIKSEKRSIINTKTNLSKDLAKCSSAGEYIVCGQDGNTYFNRCYLESAGTKEETELAKVINGECVYG